MTLTLSQEYAHRRETVSDIHEHLPVLFDAVLTHPAENLVVVECGVRTGNSTAAFLYALQVRQSGHLWSIDPQVPEIPDQWYANPQWRYLHGSDTDPRTLAAVPPAIDILFIDTSHTYEQTLEELAVYEARMNPGGIMFFHDTEVVSDVCDVSRALNVWSQASGIEWTNRTNCYGLGEIRIP